MPITPVNCIMFKIALLTLASLAAASQSGKPNLATSTYASVGENLDAKISILEDWAQKHETLSPTQFRAQITAVSDYFDETSTFMADCSDSVVYKSVINALTSKQLIPSSVQFCTGHISDEAFAAKFGRYVSSRLETMTSLKDHYADLKNRLVESDEYDYFVPAPPQWDSEEEEEFPDPTRIYNKFGKF